MDGGKGGEDWGTSVILSDNDLKSPMGTLHGESLWLMLEVGHGQGTVLYSGAEIR